MFYIVVVISFYLHSPANSLSLMGFPVTLSCCTNKAQSVHMLFKPLTVKDVWHHQSSSRLSWLFNTSQCVTSTHARGREDKFTYIYVWAEHTWTVVNGIKGKWKDIYIYTRKLESSKVRKFLKMKSKSLKLGEIYSLYAWTFWNIYQ